MVACKVTDIRERTDRRTGYPAEQSPAVLASGQMGVVDFEATKPLSVDTFFEYPSTGRIAIRDTAGTVAVGVIVYIPGRDIADDFKMRNQRHLTEMSHYGMMSRLLSRPDTTATTKFLISRPHTSWIAMRAHRPETRGRPDTRGRPNTRGAPFDFNRPLTRGRPGFERAKTLDEAILELAGVEDSKHRSKKSKKVGIEATTSKADQSRNAMPSDQVTQPYQFRSRTFYTRSGKLETEL